MGLKSKPLDQVRKDVPVHEVTKEEPVRVNLNVFPATRKLWKMEAVQRGKDVSTMIHEAMDMYLNTYVSK